MSQGYPLQLCMAKKPQKACLEDVIYSLVVPKNKHIKISSTAFKKSKHEEL